MLPNLTNGFSQKNDTTASISGGAGGQTTSDILFLKRLLFLKATLDNEATMNSFAVPFEEEKLAARTQARTSSNGRGANSREREAAPLMLTNGDEPLQLMPPPIN